MSVQALLFVHKYRYLKRNTNPSSSIVAAGTSQPGGISSPPYAGGRTTSSPRPSTYRELILSNKNRQKLAEENNKLKNEVDRIGQELNTLRRRFTSENNNDYDKCCEEANMTTSIIADVESRD